MSLQEYIYHANFSRFGKQISNHTVITQLCNVKHSHVQGIIIKMTNIPSPREDWSSVVRMLQVEKYFVVDYFNFNLAN